jgi:hypothetical protein
MPAGSFQETAYARKPFSEIRLKQAPFGGLFMQRITQPVAEEIL